MLRLLVLVCFWILKSTTASVVVCDTWLDYYVPGRPNCQTNSDTEKNVTQIIQERCGATVEEYTFTTADGYNILLVKAISSYGDYTNKPQILLGHGIFMNSLGFVSVGDESTVCRLLETNNVWIINFRGTKYSKTHTSLDSTLLPYWNFSFHEMAIYDLKGAIDLIYSATNRKIIYIGFSMGTTIGWIYQSVLPSQAAEKLLGVVFFAPVGYFISAKTILKELAVFWPDLAKPFVENVWHGEALQRNQVMLDFCSSGPEGILLCELVKIPIFGEDLEQMDPKTKTASNYINPDSIGYKVIDHYYQWITTGNLQYYDYGSAGNLLTYGSTTAPLYNVESITVRHIFLCGINDYMADYNDALLLYNQFADSAKFGFETVGGPKWNHVDFIASKCIDTCLNDPIAVAVLLLSNA